MRLIGVAVLFLLLILFLPLIAVFAEAFRRGLGAYLEFADRSRCARTPFS